MNFQYECDSFRAKIAKIPDLEKLLAKIFTYSIKHKVKAIYFEDVSLIKLKEFRQLLKLFKQVPEFIETLMRKKDEFKSQRLRLLLTSDKEGGLYPSQMEEVL